MTDSIAEFLARETRWGLASQPVMGLFFIIAQ
jgi:hypothetical protein